MKIRIADGGYRIWTSVKNAEPDHGLLLRIGDNSVFVDITGGYTWEHLVPLLASINSLKAWCAGLPCEAWVVAWDDSGPEYATIFGLGPDYKQRVGSGYRFQRIAKSGVAILKTPVEPIHSTLPVGRHALTQIGAAIPRVRYSSRWVDGVERGDGRFLYPIGGRTYFTCQTTHELYDTTLETQIDKRGLDCTTYILMAYQVHKRYQGGRGDDVAECLGCTSYPVVNQPALDVQEYFRHNTQGEFVMWSGGHVVMVVDSVVHEYTTRGINGYSRMPVSDYLGGPGRKGKYSVAVLPGTRGNPVELGQPGAGGGGGAGNGGTGGGGGGGGTGTGAGGKTYTVVSGDSLSLIAGRFYGDVLLWPILYDANRSIIGPDPNRIQPGQKLTIPDIKGYSQSQLNATRDRGRNWR